MFVGIERSGNYGESFASLERQNNNNKNIKNNNEKKLDNCKIHTDQGEIGKQPKKADFSSALKNRVSKIMPEFIEMHTFKETQSLGYNRSDILISKRNCKVVEKTSTPRAMSNHDCEGICEYFPYDENKLGKSASIFCLICEKKESDLMVAVQENNQERVKSLIEQGADINYRDGSLNTPITLALENENLQMLEFFFSDREIMQKIDWLEYGYLIHYFLSKKSWVDLIDAFIVPYVARGDLSIIQLFFKYGFADYKRESDGNDFLNISLIHEQYEVFAYLIKFNITPSINKKSKSVLDYLCQKKHLDGLFVFLEWIETAVDQAESNRVCEELRLDNFTYLSNFIATWLGEIRSEEDMNTLYIMLKSLFTLLVSVEGSRRLCENLVEQIPTSAILHYDLQRQCIEKIYMFLHGEKMHPHLL